MTDIEQLIASNPLLTDSRNSEEIFWNNSMYLPVEEAMKQTKYSVADIEDAEARLQRFADFIRVAFPETEATDGIIESPVSEISDMKNYLNDTLETTLDGKLLLKRDDLLPISGTIKARGAIYEVLKHAENLALQKGMLESTEEDYAVFASEAFN